MTTSLEKAMEALGVDQKTVYVPAKDTSTAKSRKARALAEDLNKGKHKNLTGNEKEIATTERSKGVKGLKPIASDANECTAGPAMCMMAAVEPDDYVEPKWADFVFNIWPQLSDTPAVMTEGPRGTGKTQMAVVLAARLGRPLLLVNCQPDTTAELLLGTPRVRGGSDYWEPGPIMLAAKYNAVLGLDEFNVMGPGAQLGIKPIADSLIGGLFIPYIGERIEWPDPRIICNCNPDYAGTRIMQEACRDVMETVVAGYLPPQDEEDLIVKRTGCARNTVANAVKTANAIRAAAKPSQGGDALPIKFDLSPRALFSFAKRVVAGQNIDNAWEEAVINRVGSTFQTAATREAVKQTSKVTGGFTLS